MAFEANIEKFNGPLDLMLHLIREEKLDIFDLDMELLCEQYLNYINTMIDLKLEVESEYLVELTTLLEYKSKKLLPKREDETLEDNYEEDPKERLIRRLLEYQRFKEAAEQLEDRFIERQSQYAKAMSDSESLIKVDEVKVYEGEVRDLWRAMNRVLRRQMIARPLSTKLATKEVSIEDIRNCTDILNDRLKGTIVTELKDKMAAIKPILDKSVKRHEMLFNAFYGAFVKFASETMYFSGKSNLMYQPEFSDVEKLKELMKVVDDSKLFRDLFDQKDDKTLALKTSSGSELYWVDDMAVVSSNIQINENEKARLMVVGPNRMQYDRVLSLLDYIASEIEKIYKY